MRSRSAQRSSCCLLLRRLAGGDGSAPGSHLHKSLGLFLRGRTIRDAARYDARRRAGAPLLTDQSHREIKRNDVDIVDR